jgi:hypothetical protein
VLEYAFVNVIKLYRLLSVKVLALITSVLHPHTIIDGQMHVCGATGLIVEVVGRSRADLKSLIYSGTFLNTT